MWGALDLPCAFDGSTRGFSLLDGACMCLPEDILKWDFSVVSPREDKNYTDPAATCIRSDQPNVRIFSFSTAAASGSHTMTRGCPPT